MGQFDCGRVLGWKIDGPKRIFPATIVQCNCGAEYRRTEEKFLVPHTGDAVCTVCGAALESWHPTQEIGKPPMAQSATTRHRGTLVVLAATLVMAMGRPNSFRAGDSQSYRSA